MHGLYGFVMVQAGVGVPNSEEWSQGRGKTFIWRGGTAKMGEVRWE